MLMASTEWLVPKGLVFIGTQGEPNSDGPFLLLCLRCRTHLRRFDYQLADPHGPCRLREDVLAKRVDWLVDRATNHARTGCVISSHKAWRLATRAFGQLAELGRKRRGM